MLLAFFLSPRPIPLFLLYILDLCLLFLLSNIQSYSSSSVFWTSACFSPCPMSNLALLPLHFGPLPAFHPVQCPILLFFLCILDLCLLFTLSNVQSCSSSSAFWTSACFPACSTSNLALLPLHFGPLLAFSLVQRPIHLSNSKILDLPK